MVEIFNHRVLSPRTLFFLILLLFCQAFAFSGKSYSTHVISQSDNHISIRYTFAEPQINRSGDKVAAYLDGTAMAFTPGGALLPVVTDLVNIPAQKARISIQRNGAREIAVENYIVDNNPALERATDQFEFAGLYRDIAVGKIQFVACDYNATQNTLVWYDEIVVTLDFQKEEEFVRQSRKTVTADPLSGKILSGGALYKKQSSALNAAEISYNRLPESFDHVYKIVIEQTGIYKLTYQDLLDADYPVDNINPQNLALFNKGKEVAIFVKGAEDERFNQNDYLEFFGERNEKTFLSSFPDMYADPFSDKNVYWLVDKGRQGRRLVEESGGIVETRPNRYIVPFAYEETIHYEQDTHRELFGHDPEKLNRPSHEFDHWFWGGVINAVESRSFDFDLPHPLEFGSNVFIKVMMRGASIRDNRTNPIEGHQVAIWLNEEKVGEITPDQKWQGQTMATITNAGGPGLSQLNLQNGTNTLRVDMEQVGVTDITLLNWFDVTYQRKYRADENYIRFRLQQGIPTTDRIIQFEVDGFETNKIELYKLGISKVVNGQIEYFTDDSRFSSYKLTFQDQIFDQSVEYVAVTESAKKKPLSIKPYEPWKQDNPLRRLTQSDNRASLIIITGDLLLEQVDRLKRLKEQQGFEVETVTVGQIYDDFNYGIKSPLAIKTFLKYAFENWDQNNPLQYVILAGDASWDYKGRIQGSNDIVPSIMFTTDTYGAAPSDLQYALLSGDDLIPDIVVGRIPASGSVELGHYLDKVESYQNGNVPANAWRNSSLFISGFDAGSGDLEDFTNEPVFRAQNLRLINLKLPESVFAYKLNTQRNPDLENDPDFGSTRELIDYIDEGVTFINFFGHGGGAVWADEQLFILSDIANLNNRNLYPFISSMTCFTGAFENPNKEGLAESVLMVEEKGAIAVLSSSSVGWKYNDFSIQWGLHDHLWEENVTFGQAVDLMKISYLLNPVYYTEEGSGFTRGYFTLKNSMVNQYNLLGDPTLELQKPAGRITIASSNRAPAPGETVQLTFQSTLSSASGQVEVSDRQNRKYFSENIVFNGGQAPLSFNVPDSINGNILNIKAYASDGGNDANGSLAISVGNVIVTSVKTIPAAPQVGDSISFEIGVAGDQSIQSMGLNKFRAYNSVGNTGISVPMEKVSDTLYRSTADYPGFTSAGLKYFEIVIQDDNGLHRFDLQEIDITDDRPDLRVDSESIAYGGNDELQLHFDVINDTEIAAAGVVVDVYDQSGISSGVPFYRDTLSFAANEKKSLKAPIIVQDYQSFETYRVSIDPLNTLAERDENNNVVDKTLAGSHIWVDYRTGTSSNGTENDTIVVYNDWRFFLAAQALTASSVFRFEELDAQERLRNSKQKDLKYIRTHNQQDSALLRIEVKNTVTSFQQPALLSVQLDTAKYSQFELSAVSFFRFDSFLGLWVKKESTLNGTLLTTTVDGSGLFGVFSFRDNDDPVIEITANGRPLRDGMLVRSTPALALLMQDENGINLASGFKLKLDGNEVPQSEMTFPDSITNANSVSILTSPTLASGEHSLEVEISDISNNTSTQTITFNVVANFDLIVHGNYPNPFADETFVSYDLLADNVIDDLSVRIYTLSGRLIRKRMLELDETAINDDIKNVGYHELVWDGTDDDGNQVANGVYFMVLKAKYKGQVITRKLKVARLR